MDPNATLKALRSYMAQIDDEMWDSSDSENVYNLFTALDQWLTRGGFLPSDWSALR